MLTMDNDDVRGDDVCRASLRSYVRLGSVSSITNRSACSDEYQNAPKVVSDDDDDDDDDEDYLPTEDIRFGVC
jgi:hypothetical protein